MKKKILAVGSVLLPLATIISCGSKIKDEIDNKNNSNKTINLYDKNQIFLNSLDFSKDNIKELFYGALSLEKDKYSETTNTKYAFNKEISNDILKTKKITIDDKEISFQSINEYIRTEKDITLKNVKLSIKEMNGTGSIYRVIDSIKLEGFKENENLKTLRKVSNSEIEQKNDLTISDKATSFPSQIDNANIAKFDSPNNKITKNGIDVSILLKNNNTKNDDDGKITYKVAIKLGEEEILKTIEIDGFKSNLQYIQDLKTRYNTNISSKKKIFSINETNPTSKKISGHITKLKEKITSDLKRFDRAGFKRDQLEVVINSDYNEVSFGNIDQTKGAFKFSIKLGNKEISLSDNVYVKHDIAKWEYQISEWLNYSGNINEIKKFIIRNKKLQGTTAADGNGSLSNNPIYNTTGFNDFTTADTTEILIENSVKKFFKKYTKYKEIPLPAYFSKKARYERWIDGTNVGVYLENKKYDSVSGKVSFVIRINRNSLNYKMPIEFNIKSAQYFSGLGDLNLTKTDVGSNGAGDNYKYNSSKDKLEDILLKKVKDSNSKYNNITSLKIDKKINRDGSSQEVILVANTSDNKKYEIVANVKYTMDDAEKIVLINSLNTVIIQKDTFKQNAALFENVLKQKYPEIKDFVPTITSDEFKIKDWNAISKDIVINVNFKKPGDIVNTITKSITFKYNESSGQQQITRMLNLLSFLAKKSSGIDKKFILPTSTTSLASTISSVKIDDKFLTILQNVTFKNKTDKIWTSANYDYPGDYSFESDKKLFDKDFSDLLTDTKFLRQMDMTFYNYKTNTSSTSITKGNSYSVRIKIIRYPGEYAEYSENYSKWGNANWWTFEWK